eukprot:9666175-Alexandrium_andersonii.AAC.1
MGPDRTQSGYRNSNTSALGLRHGLHRDLGALRHGPCDLGARGLRHGLDLGARGLRRGLGRLCDLGARLRHGLRLCDLGARRHGLRLCDLGARLHHGLRCDLGARLRRGRDLARARR